MCKNYKCFIYVNEEIFGKLCSKEVLANFFTTENHCCRRDLKSIAFEMAEGTISEGGVKQFCALNRISPFSSSSSNEFCYFVVFDCTLPEGHVKQWPTGFYLDEGKKLSADNIKNVYYQKLDCTLGRYSALCFVKQKEVVPMLVETKKHFPNKNPYDFRRLEFYQDCVINTNCNQANTSNLSDNGDENKGNGEDETSDNNCSESDKITKKKCVLM